MAPTDRLAARAVVLTPEERVLLMRYRFPWREEDLWITPGGALKAKEDPEEAALRELREETGLAVAHVAGELWIRQHRLKVNERDIFQREFYFLVRAHEFEPQAAALEQGGERDWFRGFKWWPIEEIPDTSEAFAPRRLGELLRRLLREGLPRKPFPIPI